MTGDDLGIGVTATDGYGTLQLRVGSGRLLCTVVLGVITPLPGEPPLNDVTGANALRCYSVSAIGAGQKVIAGADPGVVDDVFVSDEAVAIGNPNYLCVPAVVTEP